jgi:hypothetical protein
MNKDCDEFSYLKNKFPRVSEVKVKEDIFVAAQIVKFMQNKHI